MIKHSRFVQWLATGGVVALTLVVVLLLAGWRIGSEATRLLEDAAQRQRTGVEHVLDQSVQALRAAAPWAGRDCARMESDLQTAGAQQPYFRAIVLVSGGTLYCSSAIGALSVPLTHLMPILPDASDKPQLRLIDGTPMVPGRPAVLVYLPSPGKAGKAGDGVLGAIDGTYLLDMLNNIRDRDVLWGAVRFHDGVLVSGEAAPQPQLPAMFRFGLVRASSKYPFSVAFSASPALLDRLAWSLVPPFLAFGAIIAALLAVFVYRRLGPDYTVRRQIARGIRQGEFKVYYQPIIDLGSGLCIGAEALLRWHHPLHGLVRPDAFIPQAESSGLILDLTHFLLGQIRSDVAGGDLPTGTRIGINLSERHLRNRAIVGDIVRIYGPLLESYPMVAEITEHQLAAAGPAAAAAVLAELQAAGVEIALDDFGAESNAIGHLKKLRFDYLKIDKEFLPVSADDMLTRGILDAIIDLGRRLSPSLVAEGVENPSQRDYLKARGVQYAQGYLYSRPIAFADLAAYIDAMASHRMAM